MTSALSSFADELSELLTRIGFPGGKDLELVCLNVSFMIKMLMPRKMKYSVPIKALPTGMASFICVIRIYIYMPL
jgi:hypothetical protein